MLWFRKRLKWVDPSSYQKASPKVAFFKAYPWHSSILEPIASKLFTKVDLCIASLGRELAMQKPDIVVVADAGVIPFLKKVMPKAQYIHVCHGLISKNQPQYNYKHADYICVSSPYVAERLQGLKCTPKKEFWTFGLPFMDVLKKEQPIKAVKPRSSLTLLYAPTWNPTLSSADLFSTQLVKNLRGPQESWPIYIKPHPHSFHSSPEWIQMWFKLSKEHPNVRLLCEDEDLASIALKSDMIISDTSSAPFLFLALNRPILLLRNPQSTSHKHSYDPEGIEWQWRDMAYEVSYPEEIYLQINQILEEGDLKKQIREDYLKKLFANNLDGNCSMRIAKKILELTENRP